MKRSANIFLVLLLMGGFGLQAQDDPRRALAEEILAVTQVKETLERSFDMIKKMLPAQMEKIRQSTGQTEMPEDITGLTEKIMDLTTEALNWENIKDDYINLYAETFTEQEMKDMLAFYQSPTGKSFIAKQPQLMERSASISQKATMAVMPKIMELSKELMEKTKGLRPEIENQERENDQKEEQAREYPASQTLEPNKDIPIIGHPGVEPPQFTHRVQPDYPEGALNQKIQGYVILEAIMRKDGTITDIKVVRGLGDQTYGFENEAIKALKQWRFKPGKVNGVPSDVRMTMKIDFKLSSM